MPIADLRYTVNAGPPAGASGRPPSRRDHLITSRPILMGGKWAAVSGIQRCPLVMLTARPDQAAGQYRAAGIDDLFGMPLVSGSCRIRCLLTVPPAAERRPGSRTKRECALIRGEPSRQTRPPPRPGWGDIFLSHLAMAHRSGSATSRPSSTRAVSESSGCPERPMTLRLIAACRGVRPSS